MNFKETAMYHVDDPEEMTPGERLEEVSAILAKGYTAFRARNKPGGVGLFST